MMEFKEHISHRRVGADPVAHAGFAAQVDCLMAWLRNRRAGRGPIDMRRHRPPIDPRQATAAVVPYQRLQQRMPVPRGIEGDLPRCAVQRPRKPQLSEIGDPTVGLAVYRQEPLEGRQRKRPETGQVGRRDFQR